MFQKIFAAIKIEESRKTWEQLSRKLAALTAQDVVETRIEERLRLEQLIEQTKKERLGLEKKLLHMEQQRGGADSLPTSKDSPSADDFSPDWPVSPWWASALANIKLRYLLLLLIPGAGAIALFSQFQPTSCSVKQISHDDKSNASLNIEQSQVSVKGDLINAEGDITVNKTYGLDEMKLKAMLEQQQNNILKEMRTAVGDEKKLHELEQKLQAVEEKLADIQKSYEEELARRRAADKALAELKGQLPVARIAEAKKRLEQGDPEAAEQVFDEVADKEGKSVALAAYQSGQLAAGRLDYPKAMHQYRKAVTLEKDNPDYLLAAGQMARTLADYDLAQEWLERLLKVREAEKNDTSLGLVLNELGLLYRLQGKYTEAEQIIKRSLAVQEKTLGKNHPDLVLTLNNLVGLYEDHGRYVGIEPLIKRALDICEQSPGKKSSCIATPLFSLGWYYSHQGRYEDAELLFKRVLQLRKQRYGKNHLAAAFSLYALAILYTEQEGRYAEAESCYKRTLAIEENILGKSHPRVADVLRNLAGLFYKQGRYKEAEPLYKRALEIWEQSPDENHHLWLEMDLNNLAGLYYAQEKYAEAEQCYERLISIKEKELGKHHPDIAGILNNLGISYYKQGNYEKAETLYKRALAINEVAQGKESFAVATNLNNIAEIYRHQEKYDEAEPLFQRALSILKNYPDKQEIINKIQGHYDDLKKSKMAGR
ncbi:MAG: tetratricopeptide repeat protein [Candidatus Electrothrix scaldis]|nr:MAG: tetratricopeptide repeat protein [Candidatus Electrothrix sp. GW3-3]